MEQKGYNGWTNYATWLIALHIDNEEALQDEALSLHSENTYDYSKSLENWFDDLVEFLDGFKSTIVADLVRATLSSVNWYEIAEHYQHTYKEVYE